MLESVEENELLRIRITTLAMILGFSVLALVLWRVQVVRASSYESRLDRQSVRRVRLPATRGRILDRNGVILADNRPCYGVAIYMEELRQPGKWKNTVSRVMKVINRVGKILNLPPQATEEEIWRHIRKRLPLPLVVWRDIDQAAIARLEEGGMGLPGVDIYVEPVRVYPMGAIAAHVLGHVGRADPEQDEEQPWHFYLPEMEGKDGIEKTCNKVLTGRAGGLLMVVDASGYRHRPSNGGRDEKPEPEPIAGMDIVLTLDSGIQQVAERCMGGVTGAVVVIDPRNGDVLAMASSPTFNPGAFVPRMTMTQFEALNQDPGKPLVNRAVSGIYPPGSSIKPLVALAALRSGKVSLHTEFNCPGRFQLGNAVFECWLHGGHGSINIRKALEQSCNSFFCAAGVKTGHSAIQEEASALGFGAKTGIDLQGEVAGIMPTDAWKRKRFHDAWRPGDTCNLSIGQGFWAVTPLQMAVLAAAVANGGYMYRPRLVFKGEKGELARKVDWPPAFLDIVRGGMKDVVQSSSGTGKRALVNGILIAGKTGTAEYGPVSRRRKHGWMIMYAPCESPRYAAAMVVEDAVSGGMTVAPRIKELMEGIVALHGSG